MSSWANVFPEKQGLYDPELEKDSCGVGFIANIKGVPSHSILYEASFILCNMTHRGAVGADVRDGDGAGVMTAIPHGLFTSVAKEHRVKLPPLGQYAVGNLFLSPEVVSRNECKSLFEQFASLYELKVLFWRECPRDNSMIGPASKSKEPVIEQAFVVFEDSVREFNEVKFNQNLFLLRKHASNSVQLKPWFYICSLSPKNIIYKGRLSPMQLYKYFLDLTNKKFETHFALVHSRFSTNTFPSWDRAQPMRLCAHNGEINTLRGNKNWTRAREGVMESKAFGKNIEKLFPIIEEHGSDSSAFDNVLELLVINGHLSLPEAVMVMIPEAWQNQKDINPEKKAFYEWAACLMEPWDGPALITFSDGRFIGACLDRNGLRPCRFYVTKDDRMICASEVGTLPIDPAIIVQKGRLKPGKMLLVDTKNCCVVDDSELKKATCSKQPFAKWLDQNMLRMDMVLKEFNSKSIKTLIPLDDMPVNQDPRLKAFGFTLEQLNMLVLPMAREGKEALGSMGTDTPLACLSTNPRLIYDYFRQLFAQVTNPPIDPIREEIVMSLSTYIGPEGNLLEMNPQQCNRLHLPTPILSITEFDALRRLDQLFPEWKVATVDLTIPKAEGVIQYVGALDNICEQVSTLIDQKYRIAILSDRLLNVDRVPISALVALGAVHQHLIMKKQRSKIALIVETGEAREVHHMCVLLGYGADAICPYLAIETLSKLVRDKVVTDMEDNKMIKNYIKAVNNGILKVMSKMGISTLQSYKGAQIFEALGISASVVQRCFAGTASRIRGVGFNGLAIDAFALHEQAYPSQQNVEYPVLPDNGDYHWRAGGEQHLNDPMSVSSLQEAVTTKSQSKYEVYSKHAWEQASKCTLRGMLDFRKDINPIPLEEVEPWTNIVKRFCTGAMSYGSISMEAHSTLSIAMNRLGGKSNTGEGGEDPERSKRLESGDSLRSSIKQVASGRFGVDSFYLMDAEEIQIKMAQGAKPGEGGELPGYKVSVSIAKTRKSTPGVGLISPPPHHDIYSIEDLKQLIYDLKSANPRARISVKLVSEVGVGVIAAGVAKAKADHILISGHDGGTGASRWTGIKYAGLPWELGLAETHQTLVLNDLRSRVVLQTDGQIKTGRDVAVSCLLGAEEWGFATTPLIAMGCIMMRKCHLNTCPVGIATQDPELRAKFQGQPEHVINFFYFVAEELRMIMSQLGLRTVNEMVGRSDLLVMNDKMRTIKTQNIDLRPILTPAYTLRPGVGMYQQIKQDHNLELRLDKKMIELAQKSLEDLEPSRFELPIKNTDRAVGAMLSNEISRIFGANGTPQSIHIKFNGSAGQSFGAFLQRGVTLELEGDANDYVGKGLSGGRVIVYPSKVSQFKSEENIIVGNVCLYGATSGEAYLSGIASERFAVRNSGAIAVVEGVGDHCCEYMTGGRVVVLGSVGRNFGAGMSGGVAYVYLGSSTSSEALFNSSAYNKPMARDAFLNMANKESIDIYGYDAGLDRKYNELSLKASPLVFPELRDIITRHIELTGSSIGQRILDNWESEKENFAYVLPTDYKRVLDGLAIEDAAEIVESVSLKDGGNVADIEDTLASIDANKLDKVRGFVKYKRQSDKYRKEKERVSDFKEINHRLSEKELRVQAARCMDCGVPFCQSDKTGCPIGNIIPKWNELVYQNQWKQALNQLLMTNNFPEFTGRVCPAPCEGSCVLGLIKDPVSIKSIECAIIDKAFEMGWIKPQPPLLRTGKRISIIGSGPAGLAAADQLNKVGHWVTVYEREDRCGGLLMYGIPNMKLDKQIVQRRIDLMQSEGVRFLTNCEIGINKTVESVLAGCDALLLATGATWPRDLNIPNRNLDGIMFAMDYLTPQTKNLLDQSTYFSAKGRKVIVIGGGDTGNDCIGTAVRQGAASVVNFELLPQPPQSRAGGNPWPQFPRTFKIDYGHSEVKYAYGKDPREYCVLSRDFVSDGNGHVKGINTIRVEWKNEGGKWTMTEVPGTEQFFEADLVLLAMGFLGPQKNLCKLLNLEMQGNNVKTRGYKTSVEGIFAAGDCRRGQSLIVWGINEGRQAAREIDAYLMGKTLLPVSGGLVKVDVDTGIPRESLVKLK